MRPKNLHFILQTAPNTDSPVPPKGGGGGGGGGGAPPVPKDRETEVDHLIDRIVSRHGTMQNALRHLAGENYDYRERHRADEAALAAFRTRVPEGAIVLTGDDKAEFEAFKALKVKAEDVKKGLEERDQLKSKTKESDYEKIVEKAAKHFKFKPTVLSKLLKTEDLVLELRDTEVEVDGQDEPQVHKVAHVRPAKDEKADWKLLDKYVEKHLADFLPALRAEEGADTPPSKTSPTRLPSQSSSKGGKDAKVDPVNAHISATYATPGERAKQRSGQQ